jgi:hypothetical protein
MMYDEHLTKVAPNIFQRPSGRLVGRLNQNGQRLDKCFPPATPLAVAERWVQQKKAERQPRPATEMRWPGLRKVADKIFKRFSGSFVAKVYQNGRPLQKGFPPDTPLQVVERWVQKMKDGRRPRTRVKENRWRRPTKVAPNIWRLPRGGWRARVSQNGRTFHKSFPPKTPRANVERWVREKRAGRRRRLAKGTRHYLPRKVAPNIYRTLSGRWDVRINQNGRRINESFPPETPRADVDRFVQQVIDGRQLRPVNENPWHQVKVAPNIYRSSRGRYYTSVNQDGRRVRKSFSPDTPLEVVAHHVQQVIAGRQPRPVKEIQWELLTRVAPNIFQRPSGAWFTSVQQNGRRIKKSFPPETPREVVERHVQRAISERQPRRTKENLGSKAPARRDARAAHYGDYLRPLFAETGWSHQEGAHRFGLPTDKKNKKAVQRWLNGSVLPRPKRRAIIDAALTNALKRPVRYVPGAPSA